MSKTYYAIRFERTDAFHKAGELLLNADNALHIGQTESCDIRIENGSQYEDAELAIIEKRNDDKGWKLIRTSPYKEHEVRVNGTPINYVHFLSDGDHIAFEGQHQELTFNLRQDDHYTSGLVTVEGKAHLSIVAWLAAISIALVCIVLYHLYTMPMSESMIESAEQSVYQIKVDYVLLNVHCGDSITTIDSACLSNEVGTAFLTNDGKLVTARHCIEPWLNVVDTTAMDTSNSCLMHHVRMALKATTLNIIAESVGDDTRWEMVSYISISKPEYSDEPLVKLTSSDFIMNKSRDHIVTYGDYNHLYFWRSIKSRPLRTDMMLGDIAYIPETSQCLQSLPSRKGTIAIASVKEMQSLCRYANRPLVILGRTQNQLLDKSIQSPTAELIVRYSEKNFQDGYLNTVIIHNGNIGHGFSGGPVLTRTGLFGWRVIGVVSSVDRMNGNWKYSIPITEIERMNNRD